MHRFLKYVISLSLITNLLLAKEQTQPPNVILVMADDQGYGDTGYNGHPFVKTPNLDAMAKSSVVLSQFYAAAPVCSPTRASVLTGRHPFRTNVPNHGHYLRPQEITLAKYLKDAGYVTGHFGKWHIGSVQKESPTSPTSLGFDECLTGLNFFDIDPFLSDNGTYKQIKGKGSVITMDATIEFLRKHKDGGKPMFAVTWFPAPHDPHRESIDPQQYKGKKHQGYYQEITLIDHELGRLRDSLRELKIADNTIVWYCSDNGGLVKETSGGRGKKGSIYEGGLRVPCLIEWPAAWQHRVITTPASTSDILPTLLDILQIKPSIDRKLDGISLVDIISEKSTKHPPIGFWHGHTAGQGTYSDRIIKALMQAQLAGKPTPYPDRIKKNIENFPHFPKGTAYTGHAAWLDYPWKLHRIQNKQGIQLSLYNLETDPMEAHNKLNEEKERAQAMLTELQNWQRSVYDSWEGKDYLKNNEN